MTTVRNVEPFLVFLFFFVGNAILTSLHAEFFLTGLKCLATDESAECENHPIDLSLSLSLLENSSRDVRQPVGGGAGGGRDRAISNWMRVIGTCHRT